MAVTITLSPSLLIPVFSPALVNVSGAGANVSVTISISGEVGQSTTTFTDRRTTNREGVLAADISAYLRAFFSNAGSTIRHRNVTIKVTVGTQQSTTINAVALFAASSPSFPIAEPITQRFYVKYPNQKATILADDKNKTFASYVTDKDVYKASGNLDPGYTDFSLASYLGTDSVNRYVYYKTYKYNFIKDYSDCGQMFKWVDNQGFVRYFMLHEGATTIDTKDTADVVYGTMTHTTPLGTFRNKYEYPSGYEMEVSRKYYATFTTEEDRTLLQTMYTAQFIYMVDKEDKQTRVRIKRGKVTTAKGLQDFEVEIIIPSQGGLTV